jgi:hypothetical protein
VLLERVGVIGIFLILIYATYKKCWGSLAKRHVQHGILYIWMDERDSVYL